MVTGCLYLINYLMGWKLNSLFVLNPAMIVQEFEFWRLFTYPFIPGSIEGAVLFLAAFLLFAPRLEDIMGNMLFSTVLFLLLSLHGILHTLVYWKSSIPLEGMEGISIYVMSLFVLLNVQNRLKIFRLPPLKSYITPAALFALWSGFKLFRIYEFQSVDIKSLLSVGSFGLAASLMTYLQIRLAQRINFRKARIEEEPVIPQPEELHHAILSETELRRYHYNADEDTRIRPSGDRYIDEERLNDILDKINESGKESLSGDELNFLREYSKYL